MKSYRNLNEWRADWTTEKQKLFQEIKEQKYGKNDLSMLIINDNELNEITGKVIFIIPINK